MRCGKLPRWGLGIGSIGTTPIGCRPGQIFERYPEIYKRLAEPSPYSYDYLYWREDLESWLKEYDRIYQGDYARILKKYGAFRFKTD